MHNAGEYVFCHVADLARIDISRLVFLFKEQEGYTVVLERNLAEAYHLNYSYVAAWITLTVYSSLEAVGLTATFSTALAKGGISCNVVAAFFHDHIFVDVKDADAAMEILSELSWGNP